MNQLIGQRFGRLTVIAYLKQHKGSLSKWLCRCDCGNERRNMTNTLMTGRVVSCGCHKDANTRARNFRHGFATRKERSLAYVSWTSMINRCTNPNGARFKDYGGRGIRVCDRWRHDFPAFLADMGERPSVEHSLDRWPDNAGHYEPGNCRWATNTEQTNNYSQNRNLTKDGRTQSVAAWARELGIPNARIRSRLTRGWTDEASLT